MVYATTATWMAYLLLKVLQPAIGFLLFDSVRLKVKRLQRANDFVHQFIRIKILI